MCKPILDLTRPNGTNIAPPLVGLTEPRPTSGGQKAIQHWCGGANKFETQKLISLKPTEIYTYILYEFIVTIEFFKKQIQTTSFLLVFKKKKKSTKHHCFVLGQGYYIFLLFLSSLLSALKSHHSPDGKHHTK